LRRLVGYEHRNTELGRSLASLWEMHSSPTAADEHHAHDDDRQLVWSLFFSQLEAAAIDDAYVHLKTLLGSPLASVSFMHSLPTAPEVQ
jgi:hypothetical protein